MVGESFAIVALILVLSFMSVRAGKRSLAAISMPFLCVPAVYLLGEALLYTLRQVTNLPTLTLRTFAVALGLLVGLLVAFLLARRIAAKKPRLMYLVFALLFQVAFALAYITQLY